MSLTELKTSPSLSLSDFEGYQLAGRDFVNSHKRSAVWADCGLGKTAITLSSIADQLMTFENRKVLVVGTKKVAVDVWPDEIQTWSDLFNFSPIVAEMTGTPTKRLDALNTDADIYITNVENLPWLINYLGKEWPFDWVVLDESSLFKSHRSQRFKMLKKVIFKSDRVTQLTGTPSPNGLMDVWAQIYLLDKGQRLGKNITAFRREYFDEFKFDNFSKWTIKPGADKRIHDKIRDLVFRLDEKDHLKMKPLRVVVHSVTLNDKARKTYKKLLDDMVLGFSDQTVVAQNAAVLTNKLLQCANGALYTDNDGTFETIHDDKLEKLEEIINETSSSVLVAYNFKSDYVRLKQRFPTAESINDPGVIQRWNEGKVPILLAHPASAGHGLNLQKGGHVLAWFGLNWSLELYQQFIARLRRKGQKKPVICHVLKARRTIDEQVVQAWKGKKLTQDELLNALKLENGHVING